VQAQFNAPKFIKASPTAPKSALAGKQFTVTVAVDIDSPYHIQANPSKEGYIATELELGPLKGFKLDKVVYPKAKESVISGERLPVYEGKISIKAEVTADKSVKPGKYTLPISLKYQGCDQKACFPPTTLTAKTTVAITPGSK
jgi:hypothetical protein